jgi:aspartokinase
VRNVFKPQQPGTLVHTNTTPTGFKAVTTIQGLGLSAQHSGPLYNVAALVNERLSTITGSSTDVMFSSQSAAQSFACFVIPTNAGPDALHDLQNSLTEPLSQLDELTPWVSRPVSVVTVVGSRLGEDHGLTARLLERLAGIRVYALAQGPANASFSVVVEPEDAEATVLGIHELIIASS